MPRKRCGDRSDRVALGLGPLRLMMCGLALAAAATVPASAATSAPTFNRDVSPIFYRRCVGCHHPGAAAPMPLVTYQDARPWARAVKTRVEIGRAHV